MRSIKDIFLSWSVLDGQGRHTNGTDKQTNHNYGDAYEAILTKERFCPQCKGYSIGKVLQCVTCDNRGTLPYSVRDNATMIMEVGVADGSSLCAWSEIFPNATCVGLDIHPIAKTTSRVEFHLGNQLSKIHCERAAAGRQFDFICEDATHYLTNTLITLYYLWPYVKPGGLYVVEEWDGVDKERIKALWPFSEVVDTQGPFGGIESLVVFRKPM